MVAPISQTWDFSINENRHFERACMLNFVSVNKFNRPMFDLIKQAFHNEAMSHFKVLSSANTLEKGQISNRYIYIFPSTGLLFHFK